MASDLKIKVITSYLGPCAIYALPLPIIDEIDIVNQTSCYNCKTMVECHIKVVSKAVYHISSSS